MNQNTMETVDKQCAFLPPRKYLLDTFTVLEDTLTNG